MNDTAPLGTCSDVRWQQAAGVVQAQRVATSSAQRAGSMSYSSHSASHSAASVRGCSSSAQMREPTSFMAW